MSTHTPPDPATTGIIGKDEVMLVLDEPAAVAGRLVASEGDGGGGGRADLVEPSSSRISIVVSSCAKSTVFSDVDGSSRHQSPVIPTCTDCSGGRPCFASSGSSDC